MQVLKENTFGKYAVGGSTVFYMPHCDCHLYNNVLRANWSPQQLCKIAILGMLSCSCIQPSLLMEWFGL